MLPSRGQPLKPTSQQAMARSGALQADILQQQQRRTQLQEASIQAGKQVQHTTLLQQAALEMLV